MEKFADLHSQQELSKPKLIQIQQLLYFDLTHTELIQQEEAYREHGHKIATQNALAQFWDDSSKYFFAEVRQRLEKYIYSLNDAKGNTTKGFAQVAKVLTDYYQQLLGK